MLSSGLGSSAEQRAEGLKGLHACLWYVCLLYLRRSDRALVTRCARWVGYKRDLASPQQLGCLSPATAV